MAETGKPAFEWAKTTFGHLISGLQNVTWEDLPAHAKEHIKNNRKISAFQIVALAVMVVPGLVVAPALGLLGFGGIGPVAGSAAAGFQAANGATAWFSLLQSAAMGGYGAAAVNGSVSGASAAAGVITEFFKRRGEDAELGRRCGYRGQREDEETYNISTILANTSGVGTYTTSLTWPPTNDTVASGTYLDLGYVFMTARRYVNSKWTGPINVFNPVVDIGLYLLNGTTDVRIEVSMTLRSKLIQVNVSQSWEEGNYSAEYGPQAYGLSRPVVLRPYAELYIPVEEAA